MNVMIRPRIGYVWDSWNTTYQFNYLKKKNSGTTVKYSHGNIPVNKFDVIMPKQDIIRTEQKWNFETSEPASSNRRTQQRFVNMPGTVLDVTITWAEMKILKEKNEMDSLCFKGFLAQLDFKFTQGSKNQTHLTLV